MRPRRILPWSSRRSRTILDAYGVACNSASALGGRLSVELPLMYYTERLFPPPHRRARHFFAAARQDFLVRAAPPTIRAGYLSEYLYPPLVRRLLTVWNDAAPASRRGFRRSHPRVIAVCPLRVQAPPDARFFLAYGCWLFQLPAPGRLRAACVIRADRRAALDAGADFTGCEFRARRASSRACNLVFEVPSGLAQSETPRVSGFTIVDARHALSSTASRCGQKASSRRSFPAAHAGNHLPRARCFASLAENPPTCRDADDPVWTFLRAPAELSRSGRHKVARTVVLLVVHRERHAALVLFQRHHSAHHLPGRLEASSSVAAVVWRSRRRSWRRDAAPSRVSSVIARRW